MYRPKDWKNPHYINHGGGCFSNQYPEFNVYEAGADAMLERLRKDGVHLNKGDKCGAMPERGAGNLVFIPDEVRY